MSGLVPGLLALALIGAEGESSPSASEITYQVSVLEMDSIDWRGPLYHRLKLVDRQGASTIWTVSAETAQALKRRAAGAATAPKVTAAAGATANWTIGEHEREYVSGMGREANGPPHRASALALVPETTVIREKVQVNAQGRLVEGGIQTRLHCDATWVEGFHSVEVPELTVDAEGVEAGILTASFEVPELGTGHAEGEWLVPEGQALLVSLGARTRVDERELVNEEDEVEVGEVIGFHERLVLISPAQVTEPAAEARTEAPAQQAMLAPAGGVFRIVVPIGKLLAISAQGGSVARPATLKKMPALPSRTLPTARTADGTEVELPPLPDDQMTAASHEETSAEPRPSPQAHHVDCLPKPSVDPDAVRTGAEIVEAPESTPTGVFRLPLGGGLAVEIRATVSPTVRR